MKLSAVEKEIINNISEGKIKDLYTFVNFYRYGKNIKIDRDKIQSMFEESESQKRYYWNKQLRRSKINWLPEDKYLAKVEEGSINQNNYSSGNLTLSRDRGIQINNWKNASYEYNFYDGVLITDKWEEIMDFICLCQYLKSEMLIIEVPNTSIKDNLGLFYQEIKKTIDEPINYEQLTFDEGYYWENTISFSEEKAKMCEEYIDKAIVPSSKLKNYINNGYNTPEEKAQSRALTAAYIAIIVSVISIFVSIALQIKPDKKDDILSNMSNTICEIKNDLTIIRENVDLVVTDYMNYSFQNQ